MGKGANYLNNNKGVSLQASKKGKASRMVACQYGAGCNRPGCIYSHPASTAGTTFVQSNEPCMAFLAGICAFSSKGCRKRHPSKEESERLIAKYQTVRCRFSENCQTNGCLYRHPWDDKVEGEGNHSSTSVSYGVSDQSRTMQTVAGNTSYRNFHPYHSINPTQTKVSANWGYDEYFTASYSQQHTNPSLSSDITFQTNSEEQGHVSNVMSFENSYHQHNELSREGKNVNASEFVPSQKWN